MDGIEAKVGDIDIALEMIIDDWAKIEARIILNTPCSDEQKSLRLASSVSSSQCVLQHA